MLKRRDTPLTRTQKLAARSRRMRAMAASVKPREGVTMGGTTTGPAPKTKPYRDQALLDMAENQPCLLLVPGVCNHRVDQTVACHSNLGEHGKSGARKADDCYTVWGCAACHRWLDQPVGHSGPSYEQKRDAFMAAHLRQVLAWREVAASKWPERFRRAARRVLEHLNATPIGEAP